MNKKEKIIISIWIVFDILLIAGAITNTYNNWFAHLIDFLQHIYFMLVPIITIVLFINYFKNIKNKNKKYFIYLILLLITYLIYIIDPNFAIQFPAHPGEFNIFEFLKVVVGLSIFILTPCCFILIIVKTIIK